MKTRTYLLAAIIALFSMATYASPPKKVTLEFNKETGELTVTIKHKVKKVEKHFIDEIILEINDEEIEVMELDKQSSIENETVIFTLKDYKKGDEIKVIAKCNQFGKKSGKLTIE